MTCTQNMFASTHGPSTSTSTQLSSTSTNTWKLYSSTTRVQVQVPSTTTLDLSALSSSPRPRVHVTSFYSSLLQQLAFHSLRQPNTSESRRSTIDNVTCGRSESSCWWLSRQPSASGAEVPRWRHCGVTAARLRLMSREIGSGFHRLVRYVDGAGARWRDGWSWFLGYRVPSSGDVFPVVVARARRRHCPWRSKNLWAIRYVDLLENGTSNCYDNRFDIQWQIKVLLIGGGEQMNFFSDLGPLTGNTLTKSKNTTGAEPGAERIQVFYINLNASDFFFADERWWPDQCKCPIIFN